VAGRHWPVGLELGDEVEHATLALRRVEEQLLLEPLNRAEVEPRCPLREEQAKELRKELADQLLEALVVINVDPPAPAGFAQGLVPGEATPSAGSCQSRIVRSALPESACRPSGETATHQTRAVWP
jgi:hypothetical protein